jgi:hypothetical protein
MDISGYGTFCWAEVAVGDLKTAQRFYTELFGWAPRELGIGRGWSYTVLEADSEAIAGLYEIGPTQRAKGATPAWHAYVLVKDVEAVTEQVLELDGTVLSPPLDIADIGRMAVVRDPQGAVFCLWQEPPEHVPRGTTETRLGRICWTDLMTTDTDSAAMFYAALFGWSAVARNDGDASSVDFLLGGVPVAGMERITPADPDLTPRWIATVAVADVDFAIRRAVRLGGRVVRNPADRPGMGRIAVVSGPDEAPFAVVRLLGADASEESAAD